MSEEKQADRAVVDISGRRFHVAPVWLFGERPYTFEEMRPLLDDLETVFAVVWLEVDECVTIQAAAEENRSFTITRIA